MTDRLKESNFINGILNFAGAITIVGSIFLFLEGGIYGIPLAAGAIISGILLFAISDILLHLRKNTNLLNEILENFREQQ